MATPYVTPADVRMYLMDRFPSDNYLLDDTENSNEQIVSAMQLTVDKTNSIPPLIWNHTVENFPYRYELIIGTASILLRMNAFNQTRNRMDFKAEDDVAVQDKNKGAEYLAIAQQLSDEFDGRIQRIKRMKNMERSYGRVGSPYGRLSY